MPVKLPPVTLQGTMQVHAWYSEVVGTVFDHSYIIVCHNSNTSCTICHFNSSLLSFTYFTISTPHVHNV